jgi:hypothetical protein
MRKLKLVLEDLAVEAFVATPVIETARGTVDGRAEEEGTSPRCEDTPLASCDSCEQRCAADGEQNPWNAR